MNRPSDPATCDKPPLIVVGNGMVGHRFVQVAFDRGLAARWSLLVVAEENRTAYDRVHLSRWFEGAGEDELSLVEPGEYERLGATVITGDAVIALDRAARCVTTASGRVLGYDKLVLATGSLPFVPAIEGRQLPGCFVYRTLDDLAAIRAAAARAQSAAVIGGGLLGLEAAGALRTLGLQTHVVELAPRLMPLQIDEAAGSVLRGRIEALGVGVHVGKTSRAVLAGGDGRVRGLRFADGSELAVDLVVFSAGIVPRDELARGAGLTVGARGGIAIDASCRTSDENILAIGECAALHGRCYGLVAPGYRMAAAAAATLAGDPQPIDELE
ncbi:MAG TPA: FAD-dependent oxidoreductase, partial [Kofleriaceae bacterium]|nr:FAD-dependent oxidoreductase [Kofleriaceae bacterium]